MNPNPSLREFAQNRIMDFLERHQNFFNAPYGVLPGMHRLARGGKVRLITFGIAGRLDAEVRLFSVDRIEVSATGRAATEFAGYFHSVDELIAHFLRHMPEPETPDEAPLEALAA